MGEVEMGYVNKKYIYKKGQKVKKAGQTRRWQLREDKEERKGED